MFLHRLEGSWLESPFWRRAFVIQDEAIVDSLRGSGIQEIWIDISRGLDVQEAPAPQPQAEEAAPPPAAAAPAGAPARIPLHEEIARAREICAQGRDRVASMFAEIRMGRAIDTGEAVSLVDEISSSISRNPGALLGMARLKSVDDYTYMHSVAVCGLMVALGTQLGLPPEDIREAGLAGLMHDVGKALMPVDVLNKPGSLTEEEFATMKRHADKGWALLKKGGAVSDAVQKVALHHHERWDGSGYPQRLAGEQISLFARMGAICDVYDAITSKRPYKNPWDPAHAVRQMARWKGHFDPTLFQHFIRSLGIYPIGSLVRLASGYLAVVCEQTPAALLTPTVKAFYEVSRQRSIEPRRIDLAAGGEAAERIVAVEDPAQWSFQGLDQLWIES
ncbi:HD-GYP domain-containing protein [Xylophilus rhododendri]|nr:HD-GYP domain-containing protein [Xylophilus rhododendri]